MKNWPKKLKKDTKFVFFTEFKFRTLPTQFLVVQSQRIQWIIKWNFSLCYYRRPIKCKTFHVRKKKLHQLVFVFVLVYNHYITHSLSLDVCLSNILNLVIFEHTSTSWKQFFLFWFAERSIRFPNNPIAKLTNFQSRIMFSFAFILKQSLRRW